MVNRDSPIRKDFDNKQLINKQTIDSGAGFLTERTNDFLIMPNSEGQDMEDRRCAQEHHNAGHALWYLSMAVYGCIQGKSEWNNSSKTRRIIGHLSHLREFILDEDIDFKSLVTQLLEAIKGAQPKEYSEWLQFLYTNWNLIREVAKRYGDHDKCFSKASYMQVQDIVQHKQWLTVWWWKPRLKRLNKSLRHFVKSKLSVLVTKSDPSSTLFQAFFNNKMMVVLHILSFPKLKRAPAVIERALNSVEDIFHHFCPKDDRLVGLFEELIDLLKKCPNLTAEDSRRGLEIAGELLKAFGGDQNDEKQARENEDE